MKLSVLRNHLRGDKQIWWIVLLLSLISIVVVYSSIGSLAYRRAGGDTEKVFFMHTFYIVLGFVVMFLVHKIDITRYAHIARVLLVLSPILLIITMFWGVSVDNAKRWLNVFGVSVQTSDVVRLILIINLCAMLANKVHIEYKRKDLIQMITWTGLIVILISINSFSTAAILGITCVLIMWVGKVPGKYIGMLTLYMLVGVSFLLLMGFFIQRNTDYEFGRFSTVMDRTESFVGADWDGDGFIGGRRGVGSEQKNHAFVAIANGGLIGVGPGNSVQKNILPEAYSDYVYAVLVEEYGLLGGLVVLGLYLWLLYRGIVNINNTERAFGGLLCVGFALTIVLQAVAHIAVNVGLGPVTGQTLPLVSRGGSSALFTFAAIGIVLGVIKRQDADKELHS